MVFPIAGGNESKGYEISNSLRFNDGDSPDLDITSANGNEDIWTWSAWIKRSTLKSSGEQFLFCGSSNGTTNTEIKLQNDQFTYINYNGSSNNSYIRTNAKLRDTSAWYHLVCSIDMSQSTDTNRIKLYINGVHQTSLDQTTYASQNTDTYMNVNSGTHRIGADARTAANYFDGYMTEIHFVDGTAKAQTDFGEFDDNGVWIPKKYTGTYGTNGFFMQFKQTGTSQNSSGIGADTSGNDNHFAVTNLAATDVTEDTCTNNFATLNPLDRAVENASGGIVLSEGNCKSVGPNGGNRSRAQSTIGFSSGKWYAEFKIVNGNDHKTQIGMIDEVQSTTNHGGVNAGVEYRTNDDVIYSFTNGSENSGQTGLSGISNDDIVGVAINADTSPPSIQFYVNGSTKGTAVTYPNTGSIYFFFVRDGSDSGNDEPEVLCNFGNPPYSISSGNTDGKYGNFEYAPPSGYYALCTKRLAEFG